MRFILSVLVTLVAAGVTRAQITISTADLDIPNYNNRVQKIVDEQVVNFRTVVERKFWMIDRPDDVKPFRTDRYVAIHGKDLWLSRISIIQSQFPVENGKDYSVVVLSPDESYGLSSGSSGGRHSVQRYYSACEHRKQ